MVGASRAVGNALTDALGVINLSKSPSFTKSMFNEAQIMKPRSNKGFHGADDPFRSFFDGVDSTATED